MAAECEVAFPALRSVMLRVGLVNLIEIRLKNHYPIELHFDLGAIHGDNLLVPLAYRLLMILFGCLQRVETS